MTFLEFVFDAGTNAVGELVGGTIGEKIADYMLGKIDTARLKRETYNKYLKQDADSRQGVIDFFDNLNDEINARRSEEGKKAYKRAKSGKKRAEILLSEYCLYTGISEDGIKRELSAYASYTSLEDENLKQAIVDVLSAMRQYYSESKLSEDNAALLSLLCAVIDEKGKAIGEAAAKKVLKNFAGQVSLVSGDEPTMSGGGKVVVKTLGLTRLECPNCHSGILEVLRSSTDGKFVCPQCGKEYSAGDFDDDYKAEINDRLDKANEYLVVMHKEIDDIKKAAEAQGKDFNEITAKIADEIFERTKKIIEANKGISTDFLTKRLSEATDDITKGMISAFSGRFDELRSGQIEQLSNNKDILYLLKSISQKTTAIELRVNNLHKDNFECDEAKEIAVPDIQAGNDGDNSQCVPCGAEESKVETTENFEIENGVLIKYKGKDENVIIPSGVTKVGARAFMECHFLKSVIIPDGVTEIGECAFWECYSLSNITIPDGVTEIGKCAFWECYSLNNITIPDSVETIGEYAFNKCTSFESVVIPRGVTFIGDDAFNDCESVKSFKVDTKNKNYKSLYGNLYTYDGKTLVRYAPGKKAKYFKIPNEVTNICHEAFAECNSLENIFIPNSVTSIGSAAFLCCTSLKSLTLPDKLTSIGDQLLFCCRALEVINIPDGVTSIGDWAFFGCSSIKTINIPKKVSFIGYYSAFGNCASLENINVSAQNKNYKSIDGNLYSYDGSEIVKYAAGKKARSFAIPVDVEKIADNAFDYCKSLESIIIPDSVTTIGDGAFCGCTSLENITIPDSVTTIGDSAFYGCTSLGSITIPDSVTTIGDSAFYGCTSLENITIPDSVTTIGDMAFYGCTSLESIVIPESVTKVGKSLFSECINLKTINCSAESKPDDWVDGWNDGCDAEIVWGYTESDDGFVDFEEFVGFDELFKGTILDGKGDEDYDSDEEASDEADAADEVKIYEDETSDDYFVNVDAGDYKEIGRGYVTFGMYPQSRKAKDVVIGNLVDKERGYYIGSDNNLYAEKYGYEYFKVEPIRWQILQNGSEKLLVTEKIIEADIFNEANNDYANSQRREWLNNEFYNKAFNNNQKSMIMTTIVDNSLSSTGDIKNKFVCENTKDRVFLLSRKEAETYFKSGYDRYKYGSDYIKNSLYVNKHNGRSWWWLRSPYSVWDYQAQGINDYGEFIHYKIRYSNIGIAPAIKVKIGSDIKNEQDLNIEKQGENQDEKQQTMRGEKEDTEQQAKAFYSTGMRYYNDSKYTEAVKWLGKAAELGHIKAKFFLGVCFYSGYGVVQDYGEAVKLYSEAAAQGHADAQNCLGYCYENGLAVEQSYEEAINLYRKSAEQENAIALNNLGVYYYIGRCVTQSYEEAVKLFRKSAEQGYETAQNSLGNCYYNGIGVTQNYAEAAKWYCKAAEQGYAMAQNSLGVCYKNGRGVVQSHEDAVKWYRKAAEQGYAMAQYNLGCCYDNGQGVAQSHEDAVKWYRKAAEQGYETAQCALGVCYDIGQGVAQSYLEAVKWYRKAAEQGYAMAQYNLGVCYDNGQGVAQNYAEAIKWYRKAAAQGDADARRRLNEIGG